MSKLVIFAGTTEGRRLAEVFAGSGLEITVCTATEYGGTLVKDGQGIRVHTGRMNAEEMQDFIQNERACVVVDATHPFAQDVTKNIKAACNKASVEYLRLLREPAGEREMKDNLQKSDVVWTTSVEEAVKYLQGTTGNILIATGSKELDKYTGLEHFSERCYVRVLSTPEAVAEAVKCGMTGPHLTAMQGPYSKDMNAALLRQTKACFFVTKESGKTGGFEEKVDAARETGAVLVVVGRPAEEDGLSLEEICDSLEKAFDVLRNKIVSIVGIGPGNPQFLTKEARDQIHNAEIVFGAGRMLECARESGALAEGVLAEAKYLPGDIMETLRSYPECRNIAVLLSGDVSFYSGAKKLTDAFRSHGQEYNVRLIPGISSVMYLAARMETGIEDAALASLHGRDCDVAGLLRQYRKIFLLTDKGINTGELCRELCLSGFGNLRITAGSRLSYPDEELRTGTAEELSGYTFPDLCVLCLEQTDFREPVVTHGLEDEYFRRGNVPMTKQEVRSVSLSKLRLRRDSVLYDIGAGTGSIAVEAARLMQKGKVYAVEREAEGIALIRENCALFGVSNVHTVAGSAPEALQDLPAPTHAFIGGSGGKLEEILDVLFEKNSNIRIVVNAITLETLGEFLAYVKKKGLLADVVQVTASRGKKAGKYEMMTGMNPVYILTVQEEDEYAL